MTPDRPASGDRRPWDGPAVRLGQSLLDRHRAVARRVGRDFLVGVAVDDVDEALRDWPAATDSSDSKMIS